MITAVASTTFISIIWKALRTINNCANCSKAIKTWRYIIVRLASATFMWIITLTLSTILNLTSYTWWWRRNPVIKIRTYLAHSQVSFRTNITMTDRAYNAFKIATSQIVSILTCLTFCRIWSLTCWTI